LKKIILYCILTSLLACSYDEAPLTEETINLNIKDKKLHRFFSNSTYYNLKGLSYEDSTGSYKFKINNDVLTIKLGDRFVWGFQEGVVFEDTLSLYLHDLNLISTKPLIINFNNYKQKKVNFLPLFSKENLELLKNRSSKIYKLQDGGGLIEHYISEDYLNKTQSSIKELLFHESTIYNINKLKSMKIYPKGYDSFLIVHNPITGLYTLLPDFKRFTFQENDIVESISDLLQIAKSDVKSSNDTIVFQGIHNIDKTKRYENQYLDFRKGSKIILRDEAKLFFNNSTVLLNGEKTLPIEIIGEGNNSIMFKESNVDMEYTLFRNLSHFEDSKVKLPSAITFYNSKANIKNSEMKSNLTGDDYINFYNSEFSVENLLIKDVYADAIDSDFSTGIIENLILENIGNDGLDFSGSQVSVHNSSFNKVQDKAVSVGESSEVLLESSTIFNSELAVVVKDGSRLLSKQNLLRNNKVDFSVFFKKDFYPPPFLETDSVDLNNINLFQKGVILKLNNLEGKINYIEDVESLLYGETYGKASK
tara:strand:+ start:2425 stop:4026 length:1602 start_codon:yes stop_codon:yes gene_type:complete